MLPTGVDCLSGYIGLSDWVNRFTWYYAAILIMLDRSLDILS